jgi:hypothetical protein
MIRFCVESIMDGRTLIAILVRNVRHADEARFLTPPGSALQFGVLKRGAGHIVPAHLHKRFKAERNSRGARTAEVLVIQKGLVRAELYGNTRKPVCSRVLKRGDALILVAGGHGFRFLRETVLLEVKQGPYSGPSGKEFIRMDRHS